MPAENIVSALNERAAERESTARRTAETAAEKYEALVIRAAAEKLLTADTPEAVERLLAAAGKTTADLSQAVGDIRRVEAVRATWAKTGVGLAARAEAVLVRRRGAFGKVLTALKSYFTELDTLKRDENSLLSDAKRVGADLAVGARLDPDEFGAVKAEFTEAEKAIGVRMHLAAGDDVHDRLAVARFLAARPDATASELAEFLDIHHAGKTPAVVAPAMKPRPTAPKPAPALDDSQMVDAGGGWQRRVKPGERVNTMRTQDGRTIRFAG